MLTSMLSSIFISKESYTMSANHYRPLPEHVTIAQSPIEGLGLYAIVDISENQELGLTHVGDPDFQDGYIRTPLGGFINHSDTPNCRLRKHMGNMYLYTIAAIYKGDELTLRYSMYDPST